MFCPGVVEEAVDEEREGQKGLRSAQVRASDDRAYCGNIGTPYKRAYALSSYALNYVALKAMLQSQKKTKIRVMSEFGKM